MANREFILLRVTMADSVMEASISAITGQRCAGFQQVLAAVFLLPRKLL
jgi:hypothetical protein